MISFGDGKKLPHMGVGECGGGRLE